MQVFHFQGVLIRSFSIDKIFVSFFKESAGNAVSSMSYVVKISFYCFFRREQHRHKMMRFCPLFMLAFVAFFAGLVANISFAIIRYHSVFYVFGSTAFYNKNSENNKQYNDKKYQEEELSLHKNKFY